MKKMFCGVFLVLMLFVASCNDAEPRDTLEYTTSPLTESSTVEQSGTTDSSEKSEEPVQAEPTLTVTEELDQEKKAVKITLRGDGQYYFPDLKGELVENYQYEIFINSSGRYQDSPLPMASPVVAYLPLSTYLEKSVKAIPLLICKVGDDDQKYSVEYLLTMDIASLYSDEPITLKNEFLHLAMTTCFEGEYSERDLLEIESLNIYYYNPIMGSRDKSANSIYIKKRGSDEKTTYYYSDFFDMPTEETPSLIPTDILEDLSFFDGLGYLTLGDKSDGETKELYLNIMKEVAVGYHPTENTWDSHG